MSRADITIEPMREGEEDQFVQLYTHTFSQPEADMIMPMMYPMGLDHPQARQRIRAGFIASSKSDTKFCARDAKTRDLLGVCWWQTTMEPPQTAEEIALEFGEAMRSRCSLPDVPGMNTELDDAYFKTSFDESHAMTKGRPFIELRLLAVHPDHQGRGIGSELIKMGLRIADELYLPVLVISAVQGKPIYEHYGFDHVQDFPLDCRDYNGYSSGIHWTMLREPQPL